MAYDSSFGRLEASGTKPARAGGDGPFRIALLGDFSARRGRVPAESPDEIAARKPLKITFQTLDEVLESVAPRLEFSAGDDVSVELEPTELDDFQPDPIYSRVDRLSDLDEDEGGVLLRAILHHPQYQAAESLWRGTEWLLRRVQKADRIQVVLYDLTAEELAADLTASDDLTSSAVYKLLIERGAEGPDGQPWAVLIGNYTFEESAADAETLGRMARIAARAQAPFLAAIDSRAVAEGYEVPADGKPAWEALRKLPEAAYLGLATPRFLLRPPFGENYRPAESLRFEEFAPAEAGSSEGYLWSNPAIGCAALLAGGFMKSGWGFQPAQNLSLDNMPMHSYRDADDEPVAVCGEGRFTSAVSQELVKRGFMPLLSVRGRDAVELACIRSMELEGGALAGPWKGAAPSKPPALSGVPKASVGMIGGKGSGVAAPKRGESEFVSADSGASAAPSRAADPEIDPDLAALLADDSPAEPPGDSPPADEAQAETPEETPSADAPPAEENPAELDPELAALLGGDSAESSPSDAPAELDPELAALLGDTSPPADETHEAQPEALDPELAALLGESTPAADLPAPAAEADPDTGLDPELAALLGESAPSEPPAADEPPPDDLPPADEPAADETPAATSDLDPELAALLGETNPAAAESAADAVPAAMADDSGLDPELAALLGESSAPAAESPPEPEPEPPAPSRSTSPTPQTDSAMAAVTDDAPELDEGGSSAAAIQSPAEIERLMQEAQAITGYGKPGAGSPPVLDFKTLLMPVSADEPAGGGVPFDVREQLEQARKEVNPEAFAPDDPLRPDDFIKADWAGIIALAQETLREKSKNLLVAARLLEALAKKHGFAGLRDGLLLMRLLVAICWDRLDPPLDEDDPEIRAAPFNWLDDPDRGAYFPNSVRSITLLKFGDDSFSWQQWQQSQAAGAGGADVIDRVVSGANREQVQTLFDNLTQASNELRFLLQDLQGKLGPEAPGFTALRPAIDECRRLAQQILQKKGPAPASGDSGGETATNGEDGAGGGVGMGRPRFGTREDIYRELAEAADALERLEPHSPVPFLVRRAVEFGSLPFPLLMQALIRDAGVLSEMNRELGIKTAEAAS